MDFGAKPIKRLCGAAALILSLLFPAFLAAAANVEPSAVDYPPYPKVHYGAGKNADLIRRGEYLAKAGDCIACHTDTKNHGIPFAGGLGIDTPFGTFYSPNITPDKATGIGQWSDADFISAMRKGVTPHGSYYFPVFPYPAFTKINDADLLAIKAYLFSLTPIAKENKKPGVPWPLSWRFLQLGWRILFFHEGAYQNDPTQSAQWNRGAYLVQGLGHCGMCHTPLNMLGAEKKKQFLTGGFIGGYYAPDITSQGLKDASVDDIVNVFVKGEMLKGAGKVQGPMEEVNRDSLQYLDRADLYAIATYLKTVKSEEPVKSSTGPVKPGAGKKIYTSNCAVCHNTGAAGAPKLGDIDAWKPRVQQGMPLVYQHAINGFNSMPPKGTCMSCSEDEVKAAVQYLVAQSQPGAAGAEKAPTAIAAPPLPTLADGKRIYTTTCSVCHAQGLLGAPKLGDAAAWSPRLKQNIDVLFTHTIQGYNSMPPRGTCVSCTDAELQAAVKYMAQQSSHGDYSLW
jgi:cytochrome c5